MRIELTLVSNEGHFIVKQAEELIEAMEDERNYDIDDANFGYVKMTNGERDKEQGWAWSLINLFNEDHHADSYTLILTDELFVDSRQVRFEDNGNGSRKISAPLELVGWEFCKSITSELNVIAADTKDAVLYMRLVADA